MATMENAQSPSLPKMEIVHLLPCKIDYIGPAPVAEYFDSTRTINDPIEKTETASFRGRPLNGVEIPLQENGYRMYKAMVIKSTENDQDESSMSNFRLKQEIDRLMYWNLDKSTSSMNDPLPKLMRYLNGAKAFARAETGEKKLE